MVTFKEHRKEPGVIFEQPLDVRVMTIDGTWSGEGLLMEMTDAGRSAQDDRSCERIDRIFSHTESLRPSSIPSQQENVGRARADRRKLQQNQHRN
jgi:hypothetical protein